MSSAISSMGGFSASSMQQMQEAFFKKQDANNDGGINKEEFDASFKDSPLGQSGQSSEDYFNQIDTNSDGKIDQTEFTKSAEEMRAKMQSFVQSNGAEGSAGSDSTSALIEALYDKSGVTSSKNDEDEDDATTTDSSEKTALEKFKEFIAQLTENEKTSVPTGLPVH
jgi:EF-hand domain pair